MVWPARALACLFLLTAACAPAATPGASEAPPSGPPALSAPTESSRTLVTAIRAEPASLASKPGQSSGITLTTTRRLFNANLVIFDQRGEPQPYLAAQLPQVGTDSWRVDADGRMETT